MRRRLQATDMLVGGTQVDPRGRPYPERGTISARATTVIGPMRPPTMSHYIPGMCIRDFAVTESTSIICAGDFRHPFDNKVLKHI